MKQKLSVGEYEYIQKLVMSEIAKASVSERAVLSVLLTKLQLRILTMKLRKGEQV
jgi:hypothetical protein